MSHSNLSKGYLHLYLITETLSDGWKDVLAFAAPFSHIVTCDTQEKKESRASTSF